MIEKYVDTWLLKTRNRNHTVLRVMVPLGIAAMLGAAVCYYFTGG